MSFLIQYTCPKCGFTTPDFEDALIDPLGIPDLFICSCRRCGILFHRKKDRNGNIINACPKCNNENIAIHESVYNISCPKCHEEELALECIGTCF